MNWLVSIAKEIVGLFVDDGSLAIALVVWVGLILLAAQVLPVSMIGPAILIGCAAILAENVLRRAGRD
jgi:hypothetical protein